jgi:uncharacterized protein YcfL
MKMAKYTCVLLTALLIIVFASGCSSQTEQSTWKPVWEVPAEVYNHAMGKEMGNNKMMVKRLNSERNRKRYEGVIPRVFQDAKGNYRVCWIKKDPHRASYWYDMYGFSADGRHMRSAMSSIPSVLEEPDHTKIPGWNN